MIIYIILIMMWKNSTKYFFLFFLGIVNSEKSKKIPLWQKIKQHEVDLSTLTKSQKTFYRLYCIKDNVDVEVHIKELLASKTLPLNVYILRKFLEERIVMLQNSPAKNEIIKLLLDNYIHHKHHYKAITKDFKLIVINTFFRKKYFLQYSYYKYAYDCLQSLFYEHDNLLLGQLDNLHNIYGVDFTKRFIFLMMKNNIESAGDTAFLSKNQFLISIIKRILFLQKHQIKPKFFLNIFELHWYLCKQYGEIPLEEIADLIIAHKKFLVNIPYEYYPLKNNIMVMLVKIFPALVINKYPHLKELLTDDWVSHHEPYVHIFNFNKGLYAFFCKDYQKAIDLFYKALGKHVTLKERGRYTFWIANTLMCLNHQEEALELYLRTANLNINYYSAMSHMILGTKPYTKSIHTLKVDIKETFYDWYFSALKIVAEADDFTFALSLINSLHINALNHISPSMLQMLHHLQGLTNQSYLTLFTGKIYDNTGLILQEGYPLIPVVQKYPLKLAILISSILRRESFFRTDNKLTSNKGARGLMQVMPATAKTLCERNNIKYCPENLLNNHHHNVEIGLKCLEELLAIFKNSLFFVIPAYNIGSVKVRNWWNFFSTHLDFNKIEHMFLFVEMIPTHTTKHYTMDVLNNYAIFWFIHKTIPLYKDNLLNFTDKEK